MVDCAPFRVGRTWRPWSKVVGRPCKAVQPIYVRRKVLSSPRVSYFGYVAVKNRKIRVWPIYRPIAVILLRCFSDAKFNVDYDFFIKYGLA